MKPNPKNRKGNKGEEQAQNKVDVQPLKPLSTQGESPDKGKSIAGNNEKQANPSNYPCCFHRSVFSEGSKSLNPARNKEGVHSVKDQNKSPVGDFGKGLGLWNKPKSV